MHIFVSLFHSFIRSFVFQTTQWMSLTGQTTCWAWRLDSGKESHNVVGKLCKKNLQMLTCAVHHHPQEDVLFILCWCDRVRAQMSLEIGKCFSLPSLLRKVLIMWLCLDSSQSFFQADTLIQRSLCSCLCLIIRSIKLDWIAIERNQCFTIWNYTWAIVILLIQVLSPKIITDCLFILQILAKKKKILLQPSIHLYVWIRASHRFLKYMDHMPWFLLMQGNNAESVSLWFHQVFPLVRMLFAKMRWDAETCSCVWGQARQRPIL